MFRNAEVRRSCVDERLNVQRREFGLTRIP